MNSQNTSRVSQEPPTARNTNLDAATWQGQGWPLNDSFDNGERHFKVRKTPVMFGIDSTLGAIQI